MKYIRIFARRYIRLVAAGLDKASNGKIKAEQVTLFSLAGHFPAAWLIISGELFLAGFVLIFFGLMDVLDGELARFQKKASTRGMVLDASTDRIKLTIIFSAAAYYITTTNAEYVWLVPLALGSVLSIAYLKSKAEVAVALDNPKIDHHKLNRMFHEGLVDFDVINIVFIAGLLTNLLLPAIALLAVMASISLIERHYSIIRSLK
jgi:phosphatidylglycerophosphate synthase